MSKVTSFVIFCVFSIIGVLYCQGCMEVKLDSKIMVTAFTPFDKYGNVNKTGISVMIEFFKCQGISNVYLTAYYGGGPSLSYQERCDIIRAWANQGFILFVEIGAMPFVEVLKYAKFCSEMNVTALTAFSEIVYQPEDTSELVEDLNRICSASSNLPLFFHDLSVVNQELGPTTSTLAAAQEVLCLAGALASPDSYLKYKAATANVSDNCQFITDTAELPGAAFLLQMFAATTPAANYVPGLHMDMEKAAKAGDAEKVMKMQKQISTCVSAAVNTKNREYKDDTSRTYFENMKQAMCERWSICTGARYPLEIPNSTVTEEIRYNLKRLGCYCY